MTNLFISDLHLDESRPDVSRAFFNFLERETPNAEALYILGDFFEVWVGDDDGSEFSQQLIRALRKVSDSGTALYFMHGNRDFLVGDTFAQQTGATLLPDPSVVTLYGEPVLLMHGDSLCTLDEDYMAFRQQARSPEWQHQFLGNSLDERRTIAGDLRAKSQSVNSLKAEYIMDVTASEVVSSMEEHGVKHLIHGHTHRPARHTLSLSSGPAERIVLGDWHDHGWVLRVSAESYSLEQFLI